MNEENIKSQYKHNAYNQAKIAFGQWYKVYKNDSLHKIAVKYGFTGEAFDPDVRIKGSGSEMGKLDKIKEWEASLSDEDRKAYKSETDALFRESQTLKDKYLKPVWDNLNSMTVFELDQLDATNYRGITFDPEDGINISKSNRKTVDPLHPDRDRYYNEGKKVIPAGKFSLQKEHLDPVYYDDNKMTQQRTRTGLLGLGSERKLFERDGKYFTTLSFVKGGNKEEGPEYLFKGGKEKEISKDQYDNYYNKMKKRRLKNIGKND